MIKDDTYTQYKCTVEPQQMLERNTVFLFPELGTQNFPWISKQFADVSPTSDPRERERTRERTRGMRERWLPGRCPSSALRRKYNWDVTWLQLMTSNYPRRRRRRRRWWVKPPLGKRMRPEAFQGGNVSGGGRSSGGKDAFVLAVNMLLWGVSGQISRPWKADVWRSRVPAWCECPSTYHPHPQHHPPPASAPSVLSMDLVCCSQRIYHRLSAIPFSGLLQVLR